MAIIYASCDNSSALYTLVKLLLYTLQLLEEWQECSMGMIEEETGEG